MLEQEYLDLANQLKEQFDQKDQEMTDIKRENHELRKTIISCYGFVRILDNLAERSEIEMEVKAMIEIFRGYLSDEFEDLFSNNI